MDLRTQLQSAVGHTYTLERELGGGGMSPVFQLYRGKAAEGLNDPDGAKEHYARVVRWLGDCDPELVPLREQARDALARLSAEPRGGS